MANGADPCIDAASSQVCRNVRDWTRGIALGADKAESKRDGGMEDGSSFLRDPVSMRRWIARLEYR